MLIDWFTVGAQVVNFSILVWLLKRFLYKPIIDAIDSREERIALALADADAKTSEAQRERDDYLTKNEEFDRQRATLFTQATEEAKAERQRLLDEARLAAEKLQEKRHEALRNEASLLYEAISHRTRDEVFAITRKTLADLATTSLEEKMIEVFTRRLREMDGQLKKDLAASLKKASDPAVVHSAFALPSSQQAILQNALNEAFFAEIRIRFETSPDLISGIELATDGQKIAWSITDYLASLERGIDELLQEKKHHETKPEPSIEKKTNP